MPIDPTNALAMLIKLKFDVLWSYLGEFVLVFLDDNLLYMKSIEEHLEHLKKLFQLLKVHAFYAKESIFEFFAKEVK